VATTTVAAGATSAALAPSSSLSSASKSSAPASSVSHSSPAPSAHPVARAASAGASLRSLRGAIVVIDPGHNGGNRRHPEIIDRLVDSGVGREACDTTGTQTARGYTEAAFTWTLAQRLAARLRTAGARVVLTRTGNAGVGPCVTKRAAIGNRAAAAAGRGARVVAISLHADGAPTREYGFHVIEPGRLRRNAAIIAPSRRLGTALRDALRAGTGDPFSTYTGHHLGVTVRTDLGGLDLSTIPKVFIECGNMRNSADAARLSSRAWRARAATALARGLASYFAP
jgi:N-acetylmuramoyl-L-alanine amidase